MNLSVKNNTRYNIPLLATGLLIISLLVSRAALSLVSAAMILLIFYPRDKDRVLTKTLFAICCILLPVLLSGLWSRDQQSWMHAVLTRLPLLTIGIGMLWCKPNRRQAGMLIWLLTIGVLMGCCWGVLNFMQNQEGITRSYLVAKVMPTILDNDHIRFSWLIALTLLLLNWKLSIAATAVEKWAGYAVSAALVLYLHFLASKTGLLCLYTSLLIWIGNLLIKKGTRKKGLLLLAVALLLVVLAYCSFATLRNRVQYVLYDYSNYSVGKFESGSSDGARVISMKAGWFVLNQHPLLGSGFGDLKSSVYQWYTIHSPGSQDYERFIPTNEWLIYAAASGYPGAILFTVGVLLLLRPFFNNNAWQLSLLVALVIPLFTDDSFEGQYGIAIFMLVYGLGHYLNAAGNGNRNSS